MYYLYLSCQNILPNSCNPLQFNNGWHLLSDSWQGSTFSCTTLAEQRRYSIYNPFRLRTEHILLDYFRVWEAVLLEKAGLVDSIWCLASQSVR